MKHLLFPGSDSRPSANRPRKRRKLDSGDEQVVVDPELGDDNITLGRDIVLETSKESFLLSPATSEEDPNGMELDGLHVSRKRYAISLILDKDAKVSPPTSVGTVKNDVPSQSQDQSTDSVATTKKLEGAEAGRSNGKPPADIPVANANKAPTTTLSPADAFTMDSSPLSSPHMPSSPVLPPLSPPVPSNMPLPEGDKTDVPVGPATVPTVAGPSTPKPPVNENIQVTAPKIPEPSPSITLASSTAPTSDLGPSPAQPPLRIIQTNLGEDLLQFTQQGIKIGDGPNMMTIAVHRWKWLTRSIASA